MVDSLPPSGIDPDNQTIITNSKGKLSVPLADTSLAVKSSGKVEAFEPTVYLDNFDQGSGNWTGIDSVSGGIATVNAEEFKSASVTADLTDVDVLKLRIDPEDLYIAIYLDGNYQGKIHETGGFATLETSGLDYGADTTISIEARDDYVTGTFKIDYVHGINKPESGIFKLVDTGDV
jgi:hypothetical protein